MELEKYNLLAQEQLAVSLYLKSMNKAQAARDAGFESSSVFSKPSVKAVIEEQLTIRAERLRVGGDWVLGELKRVYDRCMQVEDVLGRDGRFTGRFEFDASNALKALALIGKHTDVRAFEDKASVLPGGSDLINRLNRGRQRVSERDN